MSETKEETFYMVAEDCLDPLIDMFVEWCFNEYVGADCDAVTNIINILYDYFSDCWQKTQGLLDAPELNFTHSSDYKFYKFMKFYYATGYSKKYLLDKIISRINSGNLELNRISSQVANS
jgi:hypothetical protein